MKEITSRREWNEKKKKKKKKKIFPAIFENKLGQAN